MPYYGRKRAYRSRRRYNRRRYVKKAPQTNSYMSTASKALTLASRVASLVNAEKFHFDTGSGFLSLSTTPSIIPLQLVPEGDDTQQRNGRSIKLSGLLLKLRLTSATAATTACTVRFMVFIDWWSQGAAPASTDILTGNSMSTFRNVDTISAKRFKVLKDQVFEIYPQSGASGSDKFFKMYFPVKHHLKFINSTGVQAATGSGQMYYMIFAGSNVSTNAATYAVDTRSWYYDN